MIDQAHWVAFCERALAAIASPDGGAGVTVAFLSDRAMRELNQRFRGRRETTDVLSFPEEQHPFEQATEEGRRLGDVIISVERAAAQAIEHGLTLHDELAQLILHGLLHLHGYDHAADHGEMNRMELKLRRRLRI
ncbi:MAG: rRNA maturation RNase YbeY [Pyrinomonadaceae bacterium]